MTYTIDYCLQNKPTLADKLKRERVHNALIEHCTKENLAAMLLTQLSQHSINELYNDFVELN
jgi:hypothetical protein